MSYVFLNEKHDGDTKFEIWEICVPIVTSYRVKWGKRRKMSFLCVRPNLYGRIKTRRIELFVVKKTKCEINSS